jgi:uncharacterized Zn finger protein
MTTYTYIVCPACGSANEKSQCLLGSLGQRTHYRCRYCGMTFSRSRKPRARRVKK